ncbi:MAG: GGDEF domain-containing protein [Rubrivivax sp.]|nr:GGDEF domain-containing protein [Rubrivivax sp.]
MSNGKLDIPPADEPLPGALARRLLAAVAQERGGLLAVKELASGRYLHLDEGLSQLLGRGVGSVDADCFDGATASALRAADQTAAAQDRPLWSDHKIERQGRMREYTVLRAVDGDRLACLWFDQSDTLQRQQQLRSALEQLEQQQKANSELRRELADQALRDTESGLYSRMHFEDQLRREADLSTREHREFALVLIELDPPGEAVRARGEAARVLVLEAVGRLLRGGTRAMDASCRYDDNCFAVLLSGVGLATAHSRMEGLRRRCATQIVLHQGQELGFTVAMGVASFPHTAQSVDELRRACEAALAEARRRGGNHVTLASIPLAPR